MKEFIKKIFTGRGAKYSFSRFMTFLVVIFYLIFASWVAFKKTVVPDIPIGVVWLVSALYGINKISSIDLLNKKKNDNFE